MEKPKYSGVGGHLFAIAVDKSLQWGCEGTVHGSSKSLQKSTERQVKLAGIGAVCRACRKKLSIN